MDAEEVVVNKAEVRGDLTVSCLLIVHAATKAIEGHGDDGVAGLPTDGAIFGIIDDGPHASGSFDEKLRATLIHVFRHMFHRTILA